MNSIKKLAAAVIFASSLILTGCGQAQVGCVDVEKIMLEAPRVKTLMTEADGKIKEIEEKFQQEYGDKEMTEEEAAKAQMEFQRKIEGINQAYATRIKSQLDVKVAEVSQEKNIDVVISNSADDRMIFHGAVDVTDDVIKKMQ